MNILYLFIYLQFIKECFKSNDGDTGCSLNIVFFETLGPSAYFPVLDRLTIPADMVGFRKITFRGKNSIFNEHYV